MKKLIDRHSVTCFLMYKGKTLILKRSAKVATYKGKWAAISGRIEEKEDPDRRGRAEVLEETGLSGKS